MDIQPQAQQSISDDQELAKVLAGITQQADDADTAADDAVTADAGMPPVVPMPTLEDPADAKKDAAADEIAAPAVEEIATPVVPPVPAAPAVAGSDDLSTIKTEALSELRPLVDKLNVEPEEKFDTYLLLLRSTDDKSLIAPAHEAARSIPDEARRAQALLDVIKEIDFLSGAQQ